MSKWKRGDVVQDSSTGVGMGGAPPASDPPGDEPKPKPPAGAAGQDDEPTTKSRPTGSP